MQKPGSTELLTSRRFERFAPKFGALRGMPKVHKTPGKFRPVVNQRDVLTARASKVVDRQGARTYAAVRTHLQGYAPHRKVTSSAHHRSHQLSSQCAIAGCSHDGQLPYAFIACNIGCIMITADRHCRPAACKRAVYKHLVAGKFCVVQSRCRPRFLTTIPSRHIAVVVQCALCVLAAWRWP